MQKAETILKKRPYTKEWWITRKNVYCEICGATCNHKVNLTTGEKICTECKIFTNYK